MLTSVWLMLSGLLYSLQLQSGSFPARYVENAILIATEQSGIAVAERTPFDGKWRLLAQVEFRCCILISNVSGAVKVARLGS